MSTPSPLSSQQLPHYNKHRKRAADVPGRSSGGGSSFVAWLSVAHLCILSSVGPIVAAAVVPPLRLNFAPPASEVPVGFEAACATIGPSPFVAWSGLYFGSSFGGYWVGNFFTVKHTERSASSLGTFSTVPSGTSLCILSVPVGSYLLKVQAGDAVNTTSGCFEIDIPAGSRGIYKQNTSAGAFASGELVVFKQNFNDCLRLSSCQDGSVINTWEIAQIACDATCSFCSGASASQCALGCLKGRLFTARNNGTFCDARRPYAPSGAPTVGVGSVTNSSLLLRWATPVSGGELITGYLVLRAIGGSGAYEQHLAFDGAVDGAATSARLLGLAGDTLYTFKVQAVSSVGSGDLSDVSAQVRTAPLLPDAPGSAPVVLGIGQYWINLQWAAPAYDGGSAVVSYIVEVFLVTQDAAGSAVLSLARAVTVAHASLNITELSGFTLHAFSIRAVNGIGTGPSSPASASTRTLQVPPGCTVLVA